MKNCIWKKAKNKGFLNSKSWWGAVLKNKLSYSKVRQRQAEKSFLILNIL